MNRRFLPFALTLLLCASVAGGCQGYGGDPSLPGAEPLPTMSVPDFSVADPSAPALPGATPGLSPVPTDASVIDATPDGNPDPGETAPPEDMTYKDDYEGFASENSDVIGWIDVPNTKIHYPVAIGQDNEYYLLRNYEKRKSKSGAVFMDYRNASPVDQGHIILYGHNMKNGTMFATLSAYAQENFFKKNDTLTFYWNGERTEWEVFSAFTASGTALDSKSADFILRVRFRSNQEIAEYAQLMQKKSKFTNGVEIEEGVQILSLVTCAYEYDQKVRFVVMAHRKL